jgi:hypothetical protein
MNRSKWTKTYWDLDPETGKLAPYIRLVPDFMDLEDAGYSHGLSLGGFRPDEEDAKEFAKSVDRFMDALIHDHQETYPALPHVPAEYALVPMTATPEMIQAAEEVEDLYKLGTPQTWGKVYREMIAASPNQQPAKYPIQINPFITQYAEGIFVWFDETSLPHGVECSAEAAKEALRKYGEQLEANPIEVTRRLAEDYAEQCLKAGYVTTVNCPAWHKLIQALNDLNK